MWASTILTSGKNFAPRKVSRSAARPCAASCGPPSWPLRSSAAAPVPLPPHAATAFRHDGAHRRQPSRLDRGPRPRAHPDQLSGRRHPQNSRRPLPTRSRKYPRLSVLPAHHDSHPRHPAQPLPRPPRHLPAQRRALDRGRRTRRKTIAHSTRPRSGGTRHPADPGLLAPSQGPHRARLAHLAGPPGQRTTPGRRRHLGPSQRRAGKVLRRLQPALPPSRRRSGLRLPPPTPPLRSRPLPEPALSPRGQRRSHRHSGRALDRSAPTARPSRLRRRNRRTLPSVRRHPAHLSRRRFTAGSALAPRRTRPTPPCAPHLGAETKNPDAPHLQPLRPPRFGGRYLNDNGGDRISLQLIRHFLVATTAKWGSGSGSV